jgi:integrase
MAKEKLEKGIYCRNGQYYYARTENGLVYCGKGAKGKKLAIAARGKYVSKSYERKEINAGLIVERPEFKTVGGLLDWYLNLSSIKELKNYDRKEDACQNLKTFFGKISIDNAEGDVQEDYRDYRLGQGVTHGTVDVEIQNLSAMYHLALKRKKIPAQSMPGEFVQKKDVNPRRIVTDVEFNRILKHSGAEFADFLICGWESAMRQGEIRNLTPAQVILGERHISGETYDYIYLGIFDTKTGAERIVPVSARLKEILKRRSKGLDPDDYIFTRGGKKYLDSTIAGRLKTVCKRAGILYGDKILNKKGERVGLVFHSFRHTRISKWVAAGWSDEIIRRASGHKSLEAFRRYVKLDKQVVMRLVNDTKTIQNQRKSA